MSELDSGKKRKKVPNPAPTTTFVDTSKRGKDGKCPIFCARCTIIGNIKLGHSPKCMKSGQDVTEEANDAPLAICICHCCLPIYDGSHLVPVFDRHGEYQEGRKYSQLMAEEAATKAEEKRTKATKKRARKEEGTKWASV